MVLPIDGPILLSHMSWVQLATRVPVPFLTVPPAYPYFVPYTPFWLTGLEVLEKGFMKTCDPLS